MLLNSHISAHAMCCAWKVCGLLQPTWGTSLGEDKLGARDRILNKKVVRRANIPAGAKRHLQENGPTTTFASGDGGRAGKY